MNHLEMEMDKETLNQFGTVRSRIHRYRARWQEIPQMSSLDV